MPYYLPSDYKVRSTPEYFNDVLDNAHLWQSDVYHGAVKLAHDTGAKRIVDIGCGRGGKLIPLGLYFQIMGIDYGDNIQWCKEAAPSGEWIEANLEKDVIPNETFENSITVCADVIEHLVNPEALIKTLRNACLTAEYVLLSTPVKKLMTQGVISHDLLIGGDDTNEQGVIDWIVAQVTDARPTGSPDASSPSPKSTGQRSTGRAPGKGSIRSTSPSTAS